MNWAARVTCMGKNKMYGAYKILVWILEGRDHLGNKGVDGMIILKMTTKK
jgi:hypothetical protein